MEIFSKKSSNYEWQSSAQTFQPELVLNLDQTILENPLQSGFTDEGIWQDLSKIYGKELEIKISKKEILRLPLETIKKSRSGDTMIHPSETQLLSYTEVNQESLIAHSKSLMRLQRSLRSKVMHSKFEDVWRRFN